MCDRRARQRKKKTARLKAIADADNTQLCAPIVVATIEATVQDTSSATAGGVRGPFTERVRASLKLHYVSPATVYVELEVDPALLAHSHQLGRLAAHEQGLHARGAVR